MKNARGFSLIEALMSTMVLSVGVAGLINMYSSSQSGLRWSRNSTLASHLAQQRAELLATSPLLAAPSCAGPATCRSSKNTFGPPMGSSNGFPCTQYLQETELEAPELLTDAPENAPRRFRIDTAFNDPASTTQQSGAKILTVSVCWEDDQGRVQQVQAQRMLLPEA